MADHDDDGPPIHRGRLPSWWIGATVKQKRSRLRYEGWRRRPGDRWEAPGTGDVFTLARALRRQLWLEEHGRRCGQCDLRVDRVIFSPYSRWGVCVPCAAELELAYGAGSSSPL
jgi:hypothetical protein